MWNHRTRRALLVVAALLSLAPCSAHADTSAQPPAIGEDDALYRCKSRTAEVAVTFKSEIEVKELMAWVAGFTCKNFVLDPRVVLTGKKIVLILPTKLSATEAYRVFLVALSTVSLTVVPKGNLLKIVDSGVARRDSVPLYKHGLPADTEQVVRYLLRPSYAQPETLLVAFGALKSDTGEVQQIGTMLLITDYGSHVRDMMALAKLIDVPTGSDGIYTIPVHHADAAKLAEKIGGILGIGIGIGASAPAALTPTAGKLGAPAVAGAAVPSRIMVDERTNTLIVAASEPGYLRFKALVERLDIALDIEGGASIHVYRLGSAIAEELARTLTDTIGGGPQRGATPAKPGAPTPPPPPSPADALGTSLEGQVRVIGDAPTNSLIVMSTGRDFLAIKEVIAQLDQPRRQVYIEAVILEVSLGNGLVVGSSSHGSLPLGGSKSLLVGGVQAPNLKSTSVSSLGAANGLIGGLLGSPTKLTEQLLGKSVPSYGILFQALADTSNTNVLSAPSIIALDNQEAKYKVGTNIPYQKGLSFGGITGTDVPPGSVNQNIDRVDLLLELSIKPHISIDDSVLLEIKHEAKDLGEDLAGLGPTWSTRSFDTRVLVRDQQTVIVGGLMQEKVVMTSSQVPILGDIPILGHFFKHTKRTKKKTNLLIMLTPYIVKDQMDLQAIHERKAREHDEFVQSFATLDRMKYTAKIDYARKRGVLEEINRAVLGVEQDEAARRALRRPPVIPSGAIEIPSP
ncbi:MAG: type II secretion system secretin GspD [Deltaproteobacteria bacterium]|nr:type II secretion system secretin GspD [Deltaproteobacteria bacterium]